MDLTASLCHKTFFLQSVPLSNTVSPSLVNHFFPPSRKKTDETFICEQRKKEWSSEDEGSRPNQQVSVLICYATLLFFFLERELPSLLSANDPIGRSPRWVWLHVSCCPPSCYTCLSLSSHQRHRLGAQRERGSYFPGTQKSYRGNIKLSTPNKEKHALMPSLPRATCDWFSRRRGERRMSQLTLYPGEEGGEAKCRAEWSWG